MHTGFRTTLLALVLGGAALAQTDPAAPAPAPADPAQSVPAPAEATPAPAAPAPAQSGPPASVYFENSAALPTPVNVYVDGQLVFSGVFPDSVTSFPRDVATGDRQVVITPAYAAPGQSDLLSTTVNIPSSGVYTLALDTDVNDANAITGYSVAVQSGYQELNTTAD